MEAFYIDGRAYNVMVTELKRTFAVTDTDKAGRAITGEMIRDIIGTFYNYSLSIETKGLSPAEYDELYELLSAPADFHTVSFPYGQSYLEFEAYVANGEDVLTRMEQRQNRWGGLSVNFVARAPQRRPV